MKRVNMLKPYVFNPMALYAKGFNNFETESLSDVCEQINYKMGIHTPEQSHLATILLELEKHIYNLRNIPKNEKDSPKHIEKFVRYVSAERGGLEDIINSCNDFSPEVDFFRSEFEKLLDKKSKSIPLTEDTISTLIENLKNKMNEKGFTEEKNKLRTRIEKNRQSLFKYTEFLQQKYLNLGIIRFEIAFPCRNKNEIKEFIKKYIEYKKDFLYFLTKRQFKHSVVGHIWKFQPQQKDGYISCHIVLFLNKFDLARDLKPLPLHLQDEMKILKSRWEEFIENENSFWDCNSYLEYRCTRTVFFQNNKEIKTELKRIVNYFVNPDYFIRLSLKEGFRSYGRGEIPSTP